VLSAHFVRDEGDCVAVKLLRDGDGAVSFSSQREPSADGEYSTSRMA